MAPGCKISREMPSLFSCCTENLCKSVVPKPGHISPFSADLDALLLRSFLSYFH